MENFITTIDINSGHFWLLIGPPILGLVIFGIIFLLRAFKKSSTPAQISTNAYKSGLEKTRLQLASRLKGIFSQSAQLDEATQNQVKEALLKTDIGVKTVDFLVKELAKRVGKESLSWSEIKEILQGLIVDILRSVPATHTLQAASPDALPSHPKVILLVGVNGVGKTTTAAKLGYLLKQNGKSVLFAAADTFRVAAIEQLQNWAETLETPIVAQKHGADPAAVAYDSVKSASSKKMDFVIVDTAGRLHNKKGLMEELKKISLSVSKANSLVEMQTLLVVDATTGQNALRQIEAFQEMVPLDGLVLTKMDGTAKGGVLIAASQEYRIPISYIGLGEKQDHLKVFDPQAFAKNLFEE